MPRDREPSDSAYPSISTAVTARSPSASRRRVPWPPTALDGLADGVSKLRIGLFAHRLAQHHATGIGRYLRELVLALGEVSGPGQTLLLASTPEAAPVSPYSHSVPNRVAPWPRRPTQLAWCLGRGPRLERGVGDLDVVHLIQPFPPVRTGAPQVLTVHDLFPFEHPDWYRPSERWTYRRSMAVLLRRAKRIVVPSRYIADRLASILDVDSSLVEVVPQGVSGSFARARSGRDPDGVCRRFGLEPGGFAVCVGAVSTRKNVVSVIRAVETMRGEGIPLLMIGPDGHGVEAVDAEIARLAGSARVLRTGYLPDDDVAALVRTAAVLVHPALGEGFGFVPLEAMAVGTPVIAAGVCSIPEIVGDAAVLVDEPTEPAAWAAALSQLLASPARRQALAASGRRHVLGFSWERTARRMLEIYAETASG